MACNNAYFGRVDTTLNNSYTVNYSTGEGTASGCFGLFEYNGLAADDTIAEITASDYFLGLVGELQLGSLIFISASDGDGMYVVDAITYPNYQGTGGAVTIASYGPAGSVATANIQDLAVTTAKIAAEAVTTAKIADDAVDADKLASNAVVNASVAAAAAIDFSKPATLTSGNVLVGSAGNVPTSVAMSGDATIVASGAVTLGAVVNASKADTYAPEETVAGLPVLHVFNMAGGATATRSIATAQKITAVAAWAVLKGAGSASDTVQVKNAAGNAITDALDCNVSDEVLVRAGSIDDAERVVAAGANLSCTITDGGGADVPAIDVYVLCYVTP